MHHLQLSTVATAPPPTPSISNIAATAVEISWLPPVDHFDALTVTGYWYGALQHSSLESLIFDVSFQD